MQDDSENGICKIVRVRTCYERHLFCRSLGNTQIADCRSHSDDSSVSWTENGAAHKSKLHHKT